MNAIVSRISESSVILPLRSGRVSSSSKLLDLLGQLGVVGDAGQAALPRRGVGAVLVPLPALERRDQVLVEVRHLVRGQRLDPAEADHAGGHPVGQHHHVAADRLAVAELVAHLREELGVVADVVGVVHLDAGGRLEVLRACSCRPSRRRRCTPASWRRSASWSRPRGPWPCTSLGPAWPTGCRTAGARRALPIPNAADARTLEERASAGPAHARPDRCLPTTRTPPVSGTPSHGACASDKGFRRHDTRMPRNRYSLGYSRHGFLRPEGLSGLPRRHSEPPR